jgi:hypothetical protein
VSATAESASATLLPLDPPIAAAARAVGLVALPPAGSDGSYTRYDGDVALGDGIGQPFQRNRAGLATHPLVASPLLPA